MRTKTITIDNAEFTIGALTIAQAEEFIVHQKAAIAKDDAEALAESWRGFVAQGLDNANDNADVKWTSAVVRSELDLISFSKLREQILAFSGLSLVEQKKTEVPPET